MSNWVLLSICILLLILGLLLTHQSRGQKEGFGDSYCEGFVYTFLSSGGKTNITGKNESGTCVRIKGTGSNYKYIISGIGELQTANGVTTFVTSTKPILDDTKKPRIDKITIYRPINGEGNNIRDLCVIENKGSNKIIGAKMTPSKSEFYFESNSDCGCYSSDLGGDILKLAGEPVEDYPLKVKIEGCYTKR